MRGCVPLGGMGGRASIFFAIDSNHGLCVYQGSLSEGLGPAVHIELDRAGPLPVLAKAPEVWNV